MKKIQKNSLFEIKGLRLVLLAFLVLVLISGGVVFAFKDKFKSLKLSYNKSEAGYVSGGGFLDDCQYGLTVQTSPDDSVTGIAPSQQFSVSAYVDDLAGSCASISSISVVGGTPANLTNLNTQYTAKNVLRFQVNTSFSGNSIPMPLVVTLCKLQGDICSNRTVPIGFPRFSINIDPNRPHISAVRHAATFGIPAKSGLGVIFGRKLKDTALRAISTDGKVAGLQTIYTSDNQINFVLPGFEIKSIIAKGNFGEGKISNFAQVNEVPGIFTTASNGKGEGFFYTTNGQQIKKENPASPGSEVYTLVSGGRPVSGSLFSLVNGGLQNQGDIAISRIENSQGQVGVLKVYLRLPSVNDTSLYFLRLNPASPFTCDTDTPSSAGFSTNISACGNAVQIYIKGSSLGGTSCTNQGIGLTSSTSLMLRLQFNGSYTDTSRINTPTNNIVAFPNGDIGYNSSQCPSSIVFNGRNNYLTADSSAPNLTPTGDFTVQARVLVDSQVANRGLWQGIVMKDQVINNARVKGYGLFFDPTSGGEKICGFVGPYSGNNSICGTAQTGGWHNVTFEYKAVGPSTSPVAGGPPAISLYIDGARIPTKTINGGSGAVNLVADKSMYIGASLGSSGVGDFLRGNIDEVRFYKRVLSDAEISAWQNQ